MEAGKWDEGGHSASFEGFIHWIADLDRGGLKILNEHAFDFFKALEIIVFHYITTEANTTPQAIMEKVASDDDLLFLWTMLAVDSDDEDDSVRLLKDIIKLWIKLRGHSLASAITEDYKKTKQVNLQKSKALRRQLQYNQTIIDTDD